MATSEPNASTCESLVEDEDRAYDPQKIKLISFIILTTILFLFALLKSVLATLKHYQYLTTTLQRLRVENVGLITRMRHLQNENTDLTTTLQRLRDENVDLKTRIQRLQNKNTDLTTTLQRLKAKTVDLITKMQCLQNKNTDLTTTLQCLKAKNFGLTTRMQRLEEENDQKSIKNINLKKVNELLQEDNNNIIQQLQETKTKANNKIRQHKETNINLSNEILQLQEENDDMSNKMQDLRLKNNNMEIEIEQLQEYTMCSFITESGTVAVSNEVLGKGGWGAVYTGDFYGTKVAVKKFYEIILSPHNMEILKREINIASQCRHPNLLQFICATRDDQDRLLIVTELMDMALRAFLEQRAREKSLLKHPDVKLISLDVARGLNYLHSKTPNPIIHRDVSSANVLLWIENDSVRRAKISDYGSANFMQACNTVNPGAALYAAPEAMRAQHDPKVGTFESICKSQ